MPYQNLLPQPIQDLYEVHEWRHASAILSTDFSSEWADLLHVLSTFRLYRSEVERKGGSRSHISLRIDSLFWLRGWRPKAFETAVLVDDKRHDSPTHEVDNFKNSIACDVEWNNKDPFYDRDLNNYRLLFELRALSVGIIVTRTTALQQIFKELGKGGSYGASTTHMNKLVPRVQGGSGGGCPIIVFGIKPAAYVDDIKSPQDFVPLPEIAAKAAAAHEGDGDEEDEG